MAYAPHGTVMIPSCGETSLIFSSGARHLATPPPPPHTHTHTSHRHLGRVGKQKGGSERGGAAGGVGGGGGETIYTVSVTTATDVQYPVSHVTVIMYIHIYTA